MWCTVLKFLLRRTIGITLCKPLGGSFTSREEMDKTSFVVEPIQIDVSAGLLWVSTGSPEKEVFWRHMILQKMFQRWDSVIPSQDPFDKQAIFLGSPKTLWQRKMLQLRCVWEHRLWACVLATCLCRYKNWTQKSSVAVWQLRVDCEFFVGIQLKFTSRAPDFNSQYNQCTCPNNTEEATRALCGTTLLIPVLTFQREFWMISACSCIMCVLQSMCVFTPACFCKYFKYSCPCNIDFLSSPVPQWKHVA